LIEKAVAAGHRVRIAADDPALLKRLDAALWIFSAEGFLPHAVEGDTDFPDRQPVLLGQGTTTNANGADLLAVAGGALPDAPTTWKRILYLFDGGDAAALATARAAWKAMRALDGASPSYWQESERGWQKAG
jgi:DNA polymerase-3 subunit chi